ncbi:MAG: iron chaperone [Dehalococcoidia bacterium]
MARTKPDTTIDEYISSFPLDIQAILEHVRQSIHNAAREASETISYGIPTFDWNGKHLVSFAGWKRHVSLYPLPAGDSAFQSEIAQYKRGKGSIQFPLGKSIPYELVERIVALLMAEKPVFER